MTAKAESHAPKRKVQKKAHKAPPVITKKAPQRKSKASRPVRKPSGGRLPDAKLGSTLIRLADSELRKDARLNTFSNALDYALTSRSEDREDINIIINPNFLFQYVYGFCKATMITTDRPLDYNLASQAAFYYCTNMDNVDSLGLDSWPRAMLRLAHSLRSRTVGKFHYNADWTYAAAQIATLSVGTSAYGNLGVDVMTYSTSNVNSWCPATVGSVTFPSDSRMAQWQASHADYLDLVPVLGSEKLDCGDASAFAFDVAGPAPLTSFGSGANVVLVSLFCYDTVSSTEYYVQANSSVGLETPIKHPDLAKLRLGTMSNKANTGNGYAPLNVVATRCARFVVPVISLPGTLGFSAIMKRFTGKDPQLKIVPGISFAQTLVSRLEVLGAKAGTSFWHSQYAANDIKWFAYLLQKKMLGKYAGVETGVNSLTAGVLSRPDNYAIHFDDTFVDNVRIPEPIVRFLGAQLAWVDGDGALFPLTTLYDITSLTTSLTYTGTATYLGPVPVDANAIWTQRFPIVNSFFLSKWKSNEAAYAAFANMRFNSQYGPSYLDVTMLRDTTSTQYTGVVARRRLNDVTLSQILNVAGALSYTISAVNSTFFPGTSPLVTAQYDHGYRQSHRRDLSGFCSVSLANTMGSYDGFVNAGIASSNMSGNDGPDTGPGGVPFTPQLVPPPRGPPLIRQAQALVAPRWGNYCGPGWTAGSEGDPPMKDGKYLVPPVGPEDAACKRHDEAYAHAGDDPGKISQADEAFVDEMRKLRLEGDISWRGRLAEWYFSKSAPRDKDEL